MRSVTSDKEYGLVKNLYSFSVRILFILLCPRNCLQIPLMTTVFCVDFEHDKERTGWRDFRCEFSDIL